MQEKCLTFIVLPQILALLSAASSHTSSSRNIPSLVYFTAPITLELIGQAEQGETETDLAPLFCWLTDRSISNTEGAFGVEECQGLKVSD